MPEQNGPATPAPQNSGTMIGLWVALAVIVIAIFAFMFLRNDDDAMMNESNTGANVNMMEENDAMPEENMPETNMETNDIEAEGEVNVSVPPIMENEVREFTVSGKNFSFAPTELRVKEGETVSITFVNDAGNHDLLIDEFDVDTGLVPAGESKTVTFVADKKGSFEYYCSVGQHRQMGMKGTLIVE